MLSVIVNNSIPNVLSVILSLVGIIVVSGVMVYIEYVNEKRKR